MGKWQENRCPRCGGRLFVDNDMDGWYEQCINCSYRNELKDSVELAKATVTKDARDKTRTSQRMN
jgi:DNA-directed RNA polymerase subunit M/transcription elongation factor TFIIS